MATEIVRRFSRYGSVTATDSTTGGGFMLGESSGGLLHCVSTGTNNPVTLQFWSRPDNNSATAYLLANSENGILAVVVQPGRCYQLPDELFSASLINLVLTSATTAVFEILLKS